MPMDQSGIQRNDAPADARDSHRLVIQEGYPSYEVSNNAEIPNLYRLLDLIDEHGSGGIVEKIVIDQNSLQRLLNTVHPGSYDSISKINFKALDDLSIKPIGVYGIRSEIIKFLQEAHYIDETCAALLSRTHSPDDSSPTLRSGLYLALDPDHQDRGTSKAVYIIYWPEDTTWDDQAALPSVQRNRTIFMRYLHKLTNQIIALVSSSQAKAFVWDTSLHNREPRGDQPENDEDFRLFDFEVAKSFEQEEDAVGTPGFTVVVEPSLLPQASERAGSQVRLMPGEQKPALLVIRNEKERSEEAQFDGNISPLYLRGMIESNDCPIQLGNLTPADLDVLATHGLRSRHKRIFDKYEKRLRELDAERSNMERADRKHIEDRINRDRPKIREEIQHLVRIQYDKLYPSLELELDVSHGPEVTTALYDLYSGLNKVADEIERKQKLDAVQDREFQSVKRKWPLVKEYLEKNPRLSDAEHEKWISDILAGLPAPGDTGLIYAINMQTPDSGFVFQIQRMEKGYPALSVFKQKMHDGLRRDLEALEKRITTYQLDRIIEPERHSQANAASSVRDYSYREGKRQAFDWMMAELREAMLSITRQQRRIDWIRTAPLVGQGFIPDLFSPTQLRWGGSVITLLPAQNRYSIYPLEITEQDSQLGHADEAHITEPKLDTRHKFELTLPKGQSIAFIQLIRDKCLVVVSEQDQIGIFIEDNVTIGHAVNATHAKVSLSHELLGGPQCKFAFNQATRLLVIVHGHKADIKLSIYLFDELFTNIESRGSPISLRSWYGNKPIDLNQVCFVSGLEEICLIETSGRARIFSLITQLFRNKSLQIDQPIIDAFSSPDGSCLFVIVPTDDSTSHRLLAFHWASFGDNKNGIESTCLRPCDGPRVAATFEDRGQVHVMTYSGESQTITSTIVKIEHMAPEFRLRKRAIEKINNSLIDCHFEVWKKFPMVSTVIRNTPMAIERQPRQLIFASPIGLHGLEEYFSRMISAFEKITAKPMAVAEAAIKVKETCKFGKEIEFRASEFKLGSLIVELLCLIPLHLAVTRENCFVLLKDGVYDPEYERSLRGADVAAIVDALNIGWYESLLQSYMTTKPVRVVSSMGEQGIGKSYCLNHFADTSFLGSAMGVTGGIWLSCAPTERYLLILLYFEDPNSAERGAQEEALLVLFNTAISNLVMFRNSFAISRDCESLFRNFQCSAAISTPNANLGLFTSTLIVMVKDVTKADSNDIVGELSLKLQGMIEKEKEQNFITRLHRGRIQIIPWPVISSPGFYTLFSRLHQRLDQQPFTHGTGGAFLHNLKTLMAKTKTSKWGSINHIAVHRAQQLMERLPNALRFGRQEESLLKNMDTDLELDTPDFMPVFFVPEFATENAAESELLAEQALSELVRACEETLRNRYHISDSSYAETVQNSIYEILDQRLSLVQKWVSVNIERFPSTNEAIRSLTTKLHAASLGMSNAVRLCLSGCSSCQLLCLRAYKHPGEHNCGIGHQCIFDCEVAEEHAQREPCGLPAGHGGGHVCDLKAHSCGLECNLSGKGGCAQSCTKPLHHEGEHICSAHKHFCGAPCDLRDAKHGGSGGIYSCPGICAAPWDESHDRHACGNTGACPIECALCRRLCCNTDHFHGLVSDEIHLCGQEHNCTRLCEADGICQIETRPSVIQDQFSGRHESFVYTRYTQVDRRLSCVIPIPPGELEHEGLHTHNTDEDVFHFCDARCPNCEYLCTLPLGHGQQLHETSHGSMITTQWVLQPDEDEEDPAYELQGRKFGSGDEGAPMLCNLVCAAQGRHAHIDFCRDPGSCSNTDCEHISERVHPDPDRPKDWIFHETFWARTGFKDPYSQDEQNEFSKCDVLCAGPEHEATATAAANPPYCTLPIFHPPEPQQPAPLTGHVSMDGHAFDCQNPSRLHQAYHVIFVIQSSGSMTCSDHGPLRNTPISAKLTSSCNNRYGAVLSALYGFWLSRDSVAAASSTQARQDAYSVITFDHYPTTRIQNDFTSTADQLVGQLILQMGRGGTDFQSALTMAQSLIESHWSSDRSPVIIFLSDGECNIADNLVYDLCRTCVRLGKALAFHSVSFGTDTHSASLRRMAEIAHEVYASAPQDVLTAARGNPCGYANAIDSIQLADTFLGIDNSLQKPRASLMNQYGSGGRRAIY